MGREMKVAADDVMARRSKDTVIHVSSEWFDDGTVQGWRTRCTRLLAAGDFERVHTATSDDMWCLECVKYAISDEQI